MPWNVLPFTSVGPSVTVTSMRRGVVVASRRKFRFDRLVAVVHGHPGVLDGHPQGLQCLGRRVGLESAGVGDDPGPLEAGVVEPGIGLFLVGRLEQQAAGQNKQQANKRIAWLPPKVAGERSRGATRSRGRRGQGYAARPAQLFQRSQERLIGRTERREGGPPTGGAGHRQFDSQALERQGAGNAVGPLDDANAVGFQIFIHAEIDELAFGSQTVGIEVEDRQASLVFLDEHERGAAHEAAIGDVEALGDGPGQVRLAGTQGTDQGDDSAGEQTLAQAAAEGLGGGEVGRSRVSDAGTGGSWRCEPSNDLWYTDGGAIVFGGRVMNVELTVPLKMTVEAEAEVIERGCEAEFEQMLAKAVNGFQICGTSRSDLSSPTSMGLKAASPSWQ